MNKSLLRVFLFFLIVSISFSCRKKKKNDIDPFQSSDVVCPLIGVTKETGEPMRNYEYVGKNLTRVYSIEDSKTTTMSFRYDEKNVIKTMEVETGDGSEKLTINYLYDEKGRVNQTTTSIAGVPFLTNVFVLSDGKIASVITSVNLFGSKVSGNTRIVYNGKNVSEVYTSIDGDPEKLTFLGAKYDDKPQFHPTAYKTAALGFVGIANNFFSFFGENNLVNGTIYDENGKIDQKSSIQYTYSSNGLPKSSKFTTEKNGKTDIQSVIYSFNCGK